MASIIYKNPEAHHIKCIAPMVEGRFDLVGHYGYAVAILDDGKVRVIFDEIGWQDVETYKVVFI